MPKLVLAASLFAALVLAACGASASAPSQPAVVPPSVSPVPPASPATPAPSVPTVPSTPEPADPTAEPPVATPVPAVRPTPKPTPRPTEPSFSRGEQYLADGIMRGISDCSPVREGLPGLAIAGIDCALIDSPAARMGYYLFKSDADMLDAYLARMQAEGIALDTGGCEPGEGEGAYIPYGDEGIAPDRHGCFVNREGYGNYRATLSGYHVYVGLLGRSADMRRLEDWAWLGSQDTPGNPTLWQESFVYRP